LILIQHRETGQVLERLPAPLDGQGLHFDRMKLRGADLRRAAPGSEATLNLVEAHLSYKDLSGATLEGQNLTRAHLHDADLKDADFTGARLVCASVDEACLQGAVLTDADLTGTDLQKSDLTGADLSRARLRGALLCGADLRGAILTEADLHEARLTFCRYDRHTLWPPGFDPAGARRGPGAAVSVRNYVTFQIDHTELLNRDCSSAEAIRRLVVARLSEAGIAVESGSFDGGGSVLYRVEDHTRLWNRDYAYSFRCRVDEQSFHVMVGSVGDLRWFDKKEWLVIVHPLPGLVLPVLGQRAHAACQKICVTLDRILKADPRTKSIRWYTEKAWNEDANAGATTAPDAP